MNTVFLKLYFSLFIKTKRDRTNRRDDMIMAYKFKLPALGETIMEVESASWPIKVGDTINGDDTLVDIQNDNSVEEIPSPVTGTVTKIGVTDGEVAVMGDVLVEIDVPGYEDTEDA